MNVQRSIGIAAWAALALLQIVWHAWLLPPLHTPLAATLAIALLPLAIPLLYWRTPSRALLLAGMFGLFYFCHGIAVLWAASGARPLAWIEVVLAVAVILSCARMPRRRRATRSKLSRP